MRLLLALLLAAQPASAAVRAVAPIAVPKFSAVGTSAAGAALPGLPAAPSLGGYSMPSPGIVPGLQAVSPALPGAGEWAAASQAAEVAATNASAVSAKPAAPAALSGVSSVAAEAAPSAQAQRGVGYGRSGREKAAAHGGESAAVAPRFARAASAASSAAKPFTGSSGVKPSAAVLGGVFDGAGQNILRPVRDSVDPDYRGDNADLRANFRMVKGLAGPLAKAVYPMKVHGAENVPETGAVLLIGNHPSYYDPLLTALALKRPVHFLMYKPYFEGPFKGWLKFLNPVIKGALKRLGVIPVSQIEPGNGPKEILRSLMAAREALKRGEVVAIYPEGKVWREGVMNEFMRGFEFVVRGTDAAVVPFGLRGPWGSLFSFGPKRSWWSRLLSRRPMSVSFGPELKTRDPKEARAAVAALAGIR